MTDALCSEQCLARSQQEACIQSLIQAALPKVGCAIPGRWGTWGDLWGLLWPKVQGGGAERIFFP